MASVTETIVANPARATAPRWLFTLTILTGSFLLFLVQPLLARMVLPKLGGAPAVWNSAMLVYQGLLLAGYAYAHGLTRLAPRTQVGVHLSLLLLAALTLPLGLRAADLPPGAEPVLWVPWLLLLSVGPLFFVIAAQSPLLQRWLALRGGGDPYPLFVASNIGSFAGLLSYPLLVEPLLGVEVQRLGWSWGYGALLLLVAAASLPLLRRSSVPGAEAAAAAAPLSRARVARWVLIAAIPSALMLSTSLHLTVDVAPMPLLWVVPLGLYLLSFTIAFAERRTLARWARAAAPFSLVLAASSLFLAAGSALLLAVGAALVALFTVAAALHAMLYEDRPEPARLTAFYLALSFGGAIGGLFVALLSPVIFDWTYEHPLLLLAAAGLLGGRQPLTGIAALLSGRRTGLVLWALALLLLMVVVAAWWGEQRDGLKLLTAISAALLTLALGRRWLFLLVMAVTLLAGGVLQRLSESARPGLLTRSYFGTYRIVTEAGARSLIHGTTTHGVQLLGPPERRRTPTSYYWTGSGVGRVLSALPGVVNPAARVGVVGLGTGTLACYARPDQRWTLYEIDPVVVDIARSPAFHFLRDCLPQAPVIVGDARIRLAEAPPASFDLLVIDAFSSDAIPIHLLTKEAFAVYARALRPGGLLMVHISNRHLELRPVVRTGGESVGMAGLLAAATGDPLSRGYESSWTALSSDPRLLSRVSATEAGLWVGLPRGRRVHWSDDHASILPVLKPL